MIQYLKDTHQIKQKNRLQWQKRNARVMDTNQRLLLLLPLLLPRQRVSNRQRVSRRREGQSPSSGTSPAWGGAGGGESALSGAESSKRRSPIQSIPNKFSTTLEVIHQRKRAEENATIPSPQLCLTQKRVTRGGRPSFPGRI